MKHSANKNTGKCYDCAYSREECIKLLRADRNSIVYMDDGSAWSGDDSRMLLCRLWKPKGGQ